MCEVGLITHTAYVCSKWRTATRSFSTPFWKHATARSGVAQESRVSHAAIVSCDFIARIDDVVGGEGELRRMIHDRDRERRVVDRVIGCAAHGRVSPHSARRVR